MAGSELKIGTKVPGSTIIEVVISMIIILVVFSIAMMIYSNVTRSSLSAQKVKASAILREKLNYAEHNATGADETMSVGDFQVEQQIDPYSDTASHLLKVHLTAWDNNHQKVAELQKIIIRP